MRKRILIFGASGFLGKKCYNIFRRNHDVGGTYSTKAIKGMKSLDITSQKAVNSLIERVSPDVVVHSAALVNVDDCENHQELAWDVNVEGTRNITNSCKIFGTKLIFISSDYIFDGTNSPYYEDSSPNPVNYYGITKLEAERIIREELHDYAIVRPTVLTGYNSDDESSFLKTILDKLKKSDTIVLDNDLIKYPVLIDDVAELINSIITNDLKGIFHISGKTPVTRYQWAKTIAKIFKFEAHKIEIGESYQSTPRPENVELLSSESSTAGQIEVRDIFDCIKIAKMQRGCTFKMYYNAGPEENSLGQSVAKFRISAGRALAIEHPVKADFVVPIPESGIFPAIGYSAETGIPFTFGILRDDRSDRTLFEMDLERRVSQVSEKLIPLPELIQGKSVVLIDEAVLTGTTLKKVCCMLRECGVSKIHVRIPSPIIANHCTANMLPSNNNLLYMKCNDEGEMGFYQYILSEFQIDTLGFLSYESLVSSCELKNDERCFSCFLKGSENEDNIPE